ncbi:hypothetical protein GCM10027190_00980 [Spirosoma areae]
MQDFEGRYEVSNRGEIRSLQSGNTIRPQVGESGTSYITLRPPGSKVGESVCVHIDKAVATAFLPNPIGCTAVIHIDRNLLNNEVGNLLWSLADERPIAPVAPIYAPCKVLQRQTKPISTQFRLCKHNAPTRELHPAQFDIANGQAGSEAATLQIRITVNGKRDFGFCIRMPDLPIADIRKMNSLVNNQGSILTIDPKLWDKKNRCLLGRSQAVSDFNDELLKIKLKIKEVYSLQLERYLTKIGPEPTTESVKHEYLTGEVPLTERGRLAKQKASIVGGFDAYYQYLLSLKDTELALSEVSLKKREYTRANLIDFLAYEGTPDLEAGQINQSWAKRFFSWLMQDGRMLPVSARVDVGIIRMVLAYLVEQDYLKSNPLVGLSLPKGKKKSVVWLSPEQVERLWQLEVSQIKKGQEISAEAAKSALFWFKVIVLTGMDYPDAVRYVQNRASYECMGIGGRKIVINRGKNESECHIPLTDKLTELLCQSAPRVYGLDHTNNVLKAIGESIGFPYSLTTKVGRKTAGALWLLEGYSIHEISRFLGHSSIAMTESHYVKTSAITADRGMLRMNNQREQSPFQQLHKTA